MYSILKSICVCVLCNLDYHLLILPIQNSNLPSSPTIMNLYIYIYNDFENDLKILTDIQLSLHQFDVLFIYLDKRQSDIGKELYRSRF